VQTENPSAETDDSTTSVLARRGAATHPTWRFHSTGADDAPEGSVTYTNTGRWFAFNTSHNSISELDPVSQAEVRRIEVGCGPRELGLVPGDRYLLVSNSESDSLSIIDLERNLDVRQISAGRHPRGIAVTADGRVAFVCIRDDGMVAKIDLSCLADHRPDLVEVKTWYDLGSTAKPYSAAIEPAGRRVYVAGAHAKDLSVIDTMTGQINSIDIVPISVRDTLRTPTDPHSTESPTR